ncbi:octopamine receptor beta-2R-like [Strongylocentrotus purpuratus]|uniref:G-protein coupled receptors family 1 profile domain-containing protein n=1 Tax=Strongylocentrotus purpuratus TaxID=7668 RepID=A0A7M7HJ61_STRPU|nr:octopamine receptor beta-2R-like [Strongylocentrotus purpuratus]|eukprot:XP_011681083.1 PREDICTED: nociceptin receptor-like [Strongylocentrotus purpuratus]
MANSSEVNDSEPSGASVGLMVATSFQIIFGIMGLVGNSICFAVLRRQSRKNHTNWLIVNQCFADILTSLALILVVIQLHWFSLPPNLGYLGSQLYCRLLDSRILIFSGFATSSFNLTIISVERYVAVVHPMLYVTRVKRKTMYVLAITAWLTAPTLQIVLASTQFDYRDGRCVIIDRGPAVGVALFIWEYFIPVVIMGFSFFRIAARLYSLNRISTEAMQDTNSSTAANRIQPSNVPTVSEATSTANVSTNGSGSGQAAVNSTTQACRNVRRRNITITLFIIYMTYLVCWTPNQFIFLAFNFGVLPNYIGSTGHIITTVLATLNICINPIVYAFRYKAFKKGLRNVVLRCLHLQE